jgi:hypothetical protein
MSAAMQVYDPETHVYIGTVQVNDALADGTYLLYPGGREAPLEITLRKLAYDDTPKISVGADVTAIRVGDVVYCAHPLEHVRQGCWANGKVVQGFNARGNALLQGEPSHRTFFLRHFGERNRSVREEE